MIRLHIDGKPQGQPRPRFVAGGKPYTTKGHKLAVGEIRRAWQDAGSPRLPDGALSLAVRLTVARPAGHFKSDGSLNATGQRMLAPYKQKPDLDNALKLICDALNGLAWHDDVRFVEMSCYRDWGEWPCTEIRARSLWPDNDTAAPEDAAVVTAKSRRATSL